MNFYSTFIYLCNSKGISPSKAAEEMGFARSSVTRWKTGGGVTDATINKVAQYFNVHPAIFRDSDTDGLSHILYMTAIDNKLDQAKALLEEKMGMVAENNEKAEAVGQDDPRVKRLAPFITQMTDAEIEKVLGYIQGTIAARK